MPIFPLAWQFGKICPGNVDPVLPTVSFNSSSAQRHSSGALNMSTTMDNDTKRSQKKIKITASNSSQILRENSLQQLELNPPSSSQPKRAVVKGRLAALLSLPLDVLFEIFGHLLPQDILHLSRLTKEFRRLLLARSARPIWKDAFANIPALPPCPSEMSLPAWADLVFGSHCYNCFSAKTRNVDFILRVRLCGSCARTCLISAKQFETGCKMDKVILRCVPFTSAWPSRSGSCCAVKARDAFMQQLRDRQHEDINAFVQEKKAEVKAREEHGKQCKAWYDDLAKMRAAELNKIRCERKEAIVKKLTEIGFGSDIEYLRQLEGANCKGGPPVKFGLLGDHPDVRVPKPLTERMWNNIQKSMIDYMHQLQKFRAKDDRRKLKQARKDLVVQQWYNYRQTQLENLFMPSPVDILEWDEVKAIVKSPNDVDVKLGKFEALFDESVANFIRDWQKDQLNDISNYCYTTIPGLQFTYPSARIQLAVCVFTCRGHVHKLEYDYNPDLYYPMWYPEFLHHPCNSICGKRQFEGNKNEELDQNVHLAVKQYTTPCRRQAWSSELLGVDGKASRIVRSILRGCELDPGTTSVTMLDELDLRLVCLKCSFGAKPDGERRFSVWSWRSAVQHCMKAHFGDSQVTWQKIADSDASEVRVLEEKEFIKGASGMNLESIWRCIKCIDLPDDPGTMTMTGVLNHHRWEHGRTDSRIVQGKDYYRAPECPPKQPLVVKFIPKEVK